MSYPYLIELIYRFLRLGATVAIVAIVARYIFLSVESLSGHETSAALGFDLSVSLKRMLSCVMLGGVAMGGLAYGMIQHVLRSRVVRRLGRRNKKLEIRLDPQRQSSEEGGN